MMIAKCIAFLGIDYVVIVFWDNIYCVHIIKAKYY